MGNDFKHIKNPDFVPDLMEMKKQNTIFLLKMEKKALKKKIKEKKTLFIDCSYYQREEQKMKT